MTRAGGFFTTNLEFLVQIPSKGQGPGSQTKTLYSVYVVEVWLLQWNGKLFKRKKEGSNPNPCSARGRGHFALIDGFSTDSECRRRLEILTYLVSSVL